MNDPHVKTGVRFGEDPLDRDRSWQDLQAPRGQLPGPPPRLLTGRIEYTELSAVSFGNEGGIATGVQLPLRKRERRRAAPETRGKPRTVQGQTVIETGSGKPAGFRGASERAKAIWTRSAHLHAGRRQSSMRRIKQAGHTKALDPTLGAGQGKNPCRRGRPHTKALSGERNLLTFCTDICRQKLIHPCGLRLQGTGPLSGGPVIFGRTAMRTIVHVDGFNLHCGCLKNTPWKWLDLVSLSKGALQPKHEILPQRIFGQACTGRQSATSEPGARDFCLCAAKPAHG